LRIRRRINYIDAASLKKEEEHKVNFNKEYMLFFKCPFKKQPLN